ncbi:hypothetical protein HAX54_031659, partial [Datura stramonium]|nr:hypothetical protein [Datura stramonium]
DVLPVFDASAKFVVGLVCFGRRCIYRRCWGLFDFGRRCWFGLLTAFMIVVVGLLAWTWTPLLVWFVFEGVVGLALLVWFDFEAVVGLVCFGRRCMIVVVGLVDLDGVAVEVKQVLGIWDCCVFGGKSKGIVSIRCIR